MLFRSDGVAVVDGGAVVGVVTDQDLLYQEVEADEHVPFVAPFLDWVVYVQSLGSWERHVEKAFAVTAADLMTREVRVIAASDADLAALVGRWVVAHSGFVLQILADDDAQARLALFVAMDGSVGALV